MAFDPDAYLSKTEPSSAPTPSKGFDPDAYLSKVEPKKEDTSVLGTIASHYPEAALAARASLSGARVGFAMTPPVHPLAKPVGGIAGAVVGGVAASMGMGTLEETVDKVFGTTISATKRLQEQQHPIAAFATNVAGGGLNPWMKPGMAGTLKEAAVGMGVMAGVGAGSRAVQGQNVLDPKSIAADVISGGFTKPTARGMAVLGQGTPAPKKPVDVSPRPIEGSTPEQQEAFYKKLKEEITTREAKVPLVETAIKNKETGEIELLGPKHSEKRKADTIDTHEQGFVDENGNFLDRKQAWNRAKSAGQIPEGQSAEYPKEGLHSGDLRKAGDERFKLADVPTDIEGLPVVEKTGMARDDGTVIGAKTRRGANGEPLRVDVDVNHLYNQFDDKPWTKPKVDGVHPIAEDAFKTPQEWIDFVLEHERQHVLTPIKEGQSRASYENQTNQSALIELSKNKTSAPTKQTSAKTEPVVDRTTTDPRNVKSEKEFYEIAADIYMKHGETEATKFFEGYQEYKKTWLEPIKETEEFVGINLRNKLANERVISNNSEGIKQLAGNEVDLNKLSYDIDRGETLAGKAKAVADKFRDLMDELGKRALEMGVIKGWHENYVARNVVTEGAAPPTAVQEFIRDAFGYAGGDSSGGTKTTTKYGKERKLETRQDLVEHLQGMNDWLAANGENYRFKLKSDNLAEIYHDYALSVEKAIENKNLIDNIKQVRNVNGESLIKKITTEEPLPHSWETIENAELAGYAIHPDLKPALNFVFDAGPGDLSKALGFLSQLVKRLNVVGSFFHAKSLMEVMSSAGIPIWTPLKEAVVLPLVEKVVKTTTGKQLQLSAVTKAVEQFKKGGVGDNVDKWIREGGLQLEAPEDVSLGILASTGKFADNMIAKFGPRTRILESSLSTVEKYTLGLFDKYTWDYLHTGGKLMVADAYLDKARLQAAKEGKPFDEVASRKEIAQFVDSSFGGLNWYEAARQTQSEFAKRMAMAAYSPAGRRGLQIALFAPDWTISTLRAFKMALPKELNPTKWHPVEGVKGMVTPTTKEDYARLYQFKTALTYFTLINAINMMTANRPVWENKDPTRIEWPDGTSMQAMKHAMEPYHWIMDPDKTLSNKLGFIPKAAIVGVGGLEYASPQAPKLVDRSAAGRLKAVGVMVEPFQIQAADTAPKGEGFKRAALGTMGLPVYGSTPEQKKIARAERELATKQQAWEYRDKEIKAGRMPMTDKHRREQASLRKQKEDLDRKKNK